jgi:trans-aconitate methyltransferase
MGTQETEEWAARARSFGAAAREYDRARPSYPQDLIDDVVAELPGADVVEVGAGTGKATALFAVRPLRLTCVEPDPGMAAVLRENCRSMPNVDVVVSSFEDWEPAGPYHGLVAAQSWHWTRAEHRYDKAAGLLREGGIIALFWNRTHWRHPPVGEAIDAVYRRYGIEHDRVPRTVNAPDPWPRNDLEELATFGDVEVRTYPSSQTYSATQWCDYMASTSEHLILEPAKNRALLAEVRQVIEDQSGGSIEISSRCDLYLARRTAAPA